MIYAQYLLYRMADWLWQRPYTTVALALNAALAYSFDVVFWLNALLLFLVIAALCIGGLCWFVAGISDELSK